MSTTRQPKAPQARHTNLGWALASLLRAYQKRVEGALGDLPGGARGFLVMSFVGQHTCHSQAVIAERLGLDKTALTYLIDGLEKKGLIERRTDPEDRRNRNIVLTEKGGILLAELTGAVEAVEKETLFRLDPDDAALFQAALARAAGLDEGPGAAEDEIEICRATLGPQ